MVKALLIALILGGSNFVFSQNRVHKNELSICIFTYYDFDKFPFFNSNKTFHKTLPFNDGYAISFERLQNKYFIKANIGFWNVDIPFPKYESIVQKEAGFFALGFGRKIKENKIIRVKLNSQLLFRSGLLTSYAGYYDLVDSHFYRDFGISIAGEGQIRITKFLNYNLSSGYVFYFRKYDHEFSYFGHKPFVTRHSLMLNSGFSIRF